MKARSSQARKLFFILAANRVRHWRLAIRGGFTRALRPNSTLALFSNRLRFFLVKICTDFTSIRTGPFPHTSQEFGSRCRIQSWADQHFHSVGSVLRIHIPLAASSLDGASRTATVGWRCAETQRNKSRPILSMQLEIAAVLRAVPAKLIARMAYG